MTWAKVTPAGEQGLGVWEVRAPNRPAVAAQLARLIYAHRYGVDPSIRVAYNLAEDSDIASWSLAGPNSVPDEITDPLASLVVFVRDPDLELPAYAQVCYYTEGPMRWSIRSIELDPDITPTQKLARDLFMHYGYTDNTEDNQPELGIAARPDGFRDDTGYAIRVLRCGRYMVAQCIVEDDWEVPDGDNSIYAPSTLSDYVALFTKAPATLFVAPIDTRSEALGEAAFGIRDLYASTYVSTQLRGFAYNFAWTFHDPATLAYLTLRIGAWIAELLGADRVGRLLEEYPFPASFKDLLLTLKDAFVRTADAVDDYIERLVNSGILYVRVTAHLSAVTVQITPQEES